MGVEIYFTGELKERLEKLFKREAEGGALVEELRLRVNREVMVKYGRGIFYLGRDGNICEAAGEGLVCCREDIERSLGMMSDYSLYAFNEEIRKGFITLPGGHRVGVCGQAVWDEGDIKTIKNICFMNVRIARERIGCGDELTENLFDASGQLQNTLILSPAGFGKTTLLRDIVRNVSNKGINVSVIDERSEIAACYKGIPQNDVGACTDVLDMAPKAKGIMLMLRSMSPGAIAVDEINAEEDLKAIKAASACGAALLCTAHADSRIWDNPLVKENIFNRYVYIEKQRQYMVYSGDGLLIKEA